MFKEINQISWSMFCPCIELNDKYGQAVICFVVNSSCNFLDRSVSDVWGNNDLFYLDTECNAVVGEGGAYGGSLDA